MPWLNWGAAPQNCTFYMVVFCPSLLKRVRCRICAVPEERLAFLLFSFQETTVSKLHNALINMHWWVLFLVLHWHPCLERSWRDPFCLETIRLAGAGLAYSLSAVTNVLFFSRLTQNASITAGWTRWQANLYYIFRHLQIANKRGEKKKNPLASWTFHQMVWGGRQRINKKQSWTIEEWWLLALVLLIPSLFFFMFFPAG